MKRNKRNHNHTSRGERNDITMIGAAKVILPADGTAIEVKLPEEIEYFISEDGKLMFQKKQQEPANAPENFGITYEEIAEKLFLGKEMYFSDGFTIKHILCSNPLLARQGDNAISEAQVRKQVAFAKLHNIATYLNDDWKPTFGAFDQAAFTIGCDKDGKITPVKCATFNVGLVLFPTKYTCEQAIRIMGEESIHDLLNYEY